MATLTEAKLTLRDALVCYRCGISNENEIKTLLAQLTNPPENLEEFVIYARQQAIALFPGTMCAAIANASLYTKTQVSNLLRDEKFTSYCAEIGIKTTAGQKLLAYITNIYGDGCEYRDVKLDMLPAEVEELLKDPKAIHLVSNIFETRATSQEVKDFIRVILAHLPKEERTVDNLANCVRHGIR